MAGKPGRSGGDRPTAAQNNPANVNGLGGNGQSGRYSGFKYGENKALAEQQAGAPLAQVSTFSAGPSVMPSMPQATPITAPTEMPDQPVTDGVPVGKGNNSIPGLPQPAPAADNTRFNATIQAYYPVLSYIASRPETSTETRNVLSALMNGI